jgi:hypothetical protein
MEPVEQAMKISTPTSAPASRQVASGTPPRAQELLSRAIVEKIDAALRTS